jgi:hypothetical protein
VTVEGVVTSLALRHPAGHLAARLPPGSSRRRLRGSGRRPPDPTPFRRRTTSAATLDLGRGRRKKPRAKHGPQTKAVWIRLPSPAPYAKSTAIWASDPYSRKVRQRPQHQPSIRPTRCADRAFSDTRRRLGREFASRRSGVRFPVSPPRSEALSARGKGLFHAQAPTRCSSGVQSSLCSELSHPGPEGLCEVLRYRTGAGVGSSRSGVTPGGRAASQMSNASAVTGRDR